MTYILFGAMIILMSLTKDKIPQVQFIHKNRIWVNNVRIISVQVVPHDSFIYFKYTILILTIQRIIKANDAHRLIISYHNTWPIHRKMNTRTKDMYEL